MLYEISQNDYLGSLKDIDRESIDIAKNTVHTAYGSRGIKTAMLAFDPKHQDDNELNILLGPCSSNEDYAHQFQDDMNFLNTFMRHNFRIEIWNYRGMWVLKRLDHEEIDKLPRVAHRPKLKMEGVMPLNLFFELGGINPGRIDELRIADHIEKYTVIQNGCLSD